MSELAKVFASSPKEALNKRSTSEYIPRHLDSENVFINSTSTTSTSTSNTSNSQYGIATGGNNSDQQSVNNAILVEPENETNISQNSYLIRSSSNEDKLDDKTLTHKQEDKKTEAEQQEPLQPPQRKLRILVVEDTFINQKIMLNFLRNHSVTIAANGQIAVDLTNKQTFDIIFMDR